MKVPSGLHGNPLGIVKYNNITGYKQKLQHTLKYTLRYIVTFTKNKVNKQENTFESRVSGSLRSKEVRVFHYYVDMLLLQYLHVSCCIKDLPTSKRSGQTQRYKRSPISWLQYRSSEMGVSIISIMQAEKRAHKLCDH